MSRKDGGPAFPTTDPNGDRYSGMSLRDYFAGQALQGMLAGATRSTTVIVQGTVSEHAYKIADAMLAAREAS